jgi:hypothetical protein
MIGIAVPDSIQCLDAGKLRIDSTHFLAQPLDMTVYGPIINIDLIIIGHIHQLIAAFYKTGPLRQSLE